MKKIKIRKSQKNPFLKIRILLILVVGGYSPFFFGQHDHDHKQDVSAHSSQQAVIIENKGQWGNELDGYAGLSAGSVYFQANKLHFDLYNSSELLELSEKLHASKTGIYGNDIQSMVLHKHYYQLELVGANPNAERTFSQDKQGVCNFFLGDKSTWRSNVKRFGELSYKAIYPGIDVIYKMNESELKYDFVVASQSDASAIQLRYSFTDALRIEKGQLVIVTSIGEQREFIPLAYQDIRGKRLVVPCEYQLDNNVVSFVFPKGYNHDFPLVIDPQLIASTNSGSTTTIYGHTATYDEQGNIFVGGNGFSPGGLPITAGAYQSTYGGGGSDMAINKYNSDGTQLLFSTFLGGNGDDLPHSMITDLAGNLYVLGSTNSSNFPTTASCVQATFGGGSTDITVSRFSTDGTSLIASTYLGGNQQDGINNIAYNYGDTYRGEINLATNGDILVASFSNSSNFPVTASAFQTTHGGVQDGIVARLNPTMTTPTFISFIGGSADDNAYGIVNAPDGTIYVSGSVGTGVFTFPGTPSNAVFSNTSNDGYVIRLAANGQTLVNGTYVGTAASGYSQAFFVQLDSDADVEIVVQSANGIASSPGKYQGSGTTTSIIKYTADLSTRDWVSSIAGMSPSAFLVDNCDRIYLSGHGLTGNYEVTANALYATNQGFYLFSLDAEAVTLLYGTYFGNGGSHVDGGTSRFDKNGIIYQATCSAGTFPAGPSGSYSANNNNGSYDMTVFKIDFEPNPTPFILPDQDIFVCEALPQTVNFEGTTASNVTHHWWFHDGSTSALQDPTFTYTAYGDFEVDYFPEFTEGCSVSDTVHAIVHVIETEPLVLDYLFTQGSCNDTLFIQLDFTGTADSVSWNMGNGQLFNHQDLINYYYVTPGQYIITLYAEDTVCNRNPTETITLNHDGHQGAGELFMPNVFSCNGDGTNDTYQISSIGYSSTEVFADLEYYSIQIVNRWGNPVFESTPTDPQTWSWGGKVNGNKVEEGVYFYLVKYKTVCMEEEIEKQGFVQVVR